MSDESNSLATNSGNTLSGNKLSTDVVGLGKCTEKVMDFFSDCMRPTNRKRGAKALIAEAKAELEVEKIKLEAAQVERRRRAVERFVDDQDRQQVNIEAVQEIAQKHAAACDQQGGVPTTAQPDIDKLHWFEDWYKNVSDGQVQEFAGRLLAGEIIKPGSFSRSAVNALMLMDKEDARLLRDIGQHRVYFGENCVLPKLTGAPDVPFAPMQRLQELGLVGAANTAVSPTLTVDPSTQRGAPIAVGAGSRWYAMWNAQNVRFPVVTFTRAGIELLPLLAAAPPSRADAFSYLVPAIEAIGGVIIEYEVSSENPQEIRGRPIRELTPVERKRAGLDKVASG